VRLCFGAIERTHIPGAAHRAGEQTDSGACGKLEPENIARKLKGLSAISEYSFVTVRGRKLEVRTIAGANRDAPTLVFLHEGLGSVSMWRDFPEKAAAATGCAAVVYSRYGYGQSDALREPRAVNYMHTEALEMLPELLEKLTIREPVLVGHSDGASIALLYAAARDGVSGLVLMAPHVFVEDLSVKSIAEAKTAFESTDLPQKLGRHHADAAKTFRGWNDIWLHPDFRGWNIEEVLPRVVCPVLAIQGFDDEYGTMGQLEAVAKQTGGPVELLRLADCRHSPHRDQPGVVLEAMARFIGRLGDGA
jgi:pimeloyl-ACP methyl ester carboxylesterase